MPCPRCGQNRSQNQVPISSSQPRPGSAPRPQQSPQRVVTSSDAIRNAIGGLRYVPR